MAGLSLRFRRLRQVGLNPRHIKAFGKRVMLRAASGANATAASRTIGTTNSAVTYTAPVWRGVGGNAIRVAHIVAGNNTPLSVSVSGRDITVNVATSGVGAATSTATQVAAAVNASVPVADLGVLATAGGTGAGVVVAGAMGNLTGGAGGS